MDIEEVAEKLGATKIDRGYKFLKGQQYVMQSANRIVVDTVLNELTFNGIGDVYVLPAPITPGTVIRDAEDEFLVWKFVPQISKYAWSSLHNSEWWDEEDITDYTVLFTPET